MLGISKFALVPLFAAVLMAADELHGRLSRLRNGMWKMRSNC